ncbi:MAG: SpoIID/LytB domain-containing protein, partial [Elusimicrobiota bacterium]|nr:SpoIID/LytB domain-containing protein [Elusimicrobiota bacterium]
YPVEASAEGIDIAGQSLSDLMRIVSRDGDEFLTVNGRWYRDTVIIKKTAGGLTAINELGIDGYLFGVLPVEVSPGWPIESLKAQAVVSRTYVVNNIGKYENDGYDLSSDVFSQMYRGVEVENSKSNRAVAETAGRVLTYKGDLAKAYFFSSCGGYTASSKEVWGNDIPYMRGVTCPYCKDSPRYRWEEKVSPATIKEALNKRGYNIGDVKDIEFLSRADSGRIRDMVIVHSGGKTAITGHKFRMAVGPNIIKSTMMSIDRSKKNFLFYGRGWGHGAGMCQWGAKGQAEAGKSYKDILKFYFPGTEVKKWAY